MISNKECSKQTTSNLVESYKCNCLHKKTEYEVLCKVEDENQLDHQLRQKRAELLNQCEPLFMMEIDVIEIYREVMPWISTREMIKQCLIQELPSIEIKEKGSPEEEHDPRD